LNILEQFLDLVGYLQASILGRVVRARDLLTTIFVLFLIIVRWFLMLNGCWLLSSTRCAALLLLILLHLRFLLLSLCGAHVNLIFLLVRVDFLAIVDLDGEIERLIFHLLALDIALASG
jgi:hypothetical protein